MKLEQVLEESRKYDEMFRGVPETVNGRRTSSIISENITWLRRVNNRTDFVTWYLRILRLAIFKEFDRTANTRFVYDEMDRYNKKAREVQFRNRGQIPGLDGIQTIRTLFEHFFSLPIREIQNFRFRWETSDEVIEHFSAYEEEWKASRPEGVVDSSNEKVFLDVGNNYVWFDLDRASCDVEGDAMGHCGNSPAGDDPNQTILSLREKTREGWRVALTFIYHKRQRALGEMKGRGNDKPAPKYHKYILALLLDDRIERIEGGGYMPESNFSVLDLDEATQDKIKNKKPTLFTLPEYVNKYGADGYASEQIKTRYGYDLWEDGSVIVSRYGEIDDLINESAKLEAEHYISVITHDIYPKERVFEEDIVMAIENSTHREEFADVVTTYIGRDAGTTKTTVERLGYADQFKYEELVEAYSNAMLDQTQEEILANIESDMDGMDATVDIETSSGSTSNVPARVSTESIEGPIVVMDINEFVFRVMDNTEDAAPEYITTRVTNVDIPPFNRYESLDREQFDDLLMELIDEIKEDN